MTDALSVSFADSSPKGRAKESEGPTPHPALRATFSSIAVAPESRDLPLLAFKKCADGSLSQLRWDRCLKGKARGNEGTNNPSVASGDSSLYTRKPVNRNTEIHPILYGMDFAHKPKIYQKRSIENPLHS